MKKNNNKQSNKTIKTFVSNSETTLAFFRRDEKYSCLGSDTQDHFMSSPNVLFASFPDFFLLLLRAFTKLCSWKTFSQKRQNVELGYTGAVSGDSRVNGLKKLQRILARNSHLERLNLLRGLNCKNSSYEFVYKRNKLFIKKRWPSDRIAKKPSKILINTFSCRWRSLRSATF